jgi:coenzyme F420 biosynthesis associated uncharacterized protein
MVDWEAAAALGERLVPAGPDVGAREADEAVAELAAAAAAAVAPVREASGLTADPALHTTAIVDRPQWIRSNIDGMARMLAPVADRLADRPAPGWAADLTAKAAAVEVGAALSWVATKVLGQYEALTAPGEPGRLLLVAPNIVATERQLQVPARDFRMWVALHEETHRVQFGAVDWLEGYFRAELDSFLADINLTNAEAAKRLGAVVVAVVRVLGGAPGATIIDAVQSPQQREVFLRLTAFMSLLEGHADYVMDAAGPEVVPALPTIRERFERRRRNPSPGDGLMRRLLGMDAKLRQYSDGRRFVTEVVAAEGVAGFNRVWQSPDTLPRTGEIAQPRLWLNRVLG